MAKYLIVVDMQKDFIDGALGTAEAAGIVPAVQAFVSAWDGPVLFTRDTHGAEYMETEEGKNLPVPHCLKGSEGWQIEEGLDAFRKEHACPVFDKVTFGSRGLGEYLAAENEKEKIEEVVLIGLCTDICVISNAFLVKAFLPDAHVAVAADCCAGVTPESHETALTAMRACQVEVR